jgi:hypothetical protein
VPSAVHPATLLSAEYRQLISGLTLDIQSLSTQEILQRLKEQELHLGLAYYDAVLKKEDLEKIPAWDPIL